METPEQELARLRQPLAEPQAEAGGESGGCSEHALFHYVAYMSDGTLHDLDVGISSAVLNVSGKLPDDVGLDEFNLITAAVEDVVRGAIQIRFVGGDPHDAEQRDRELRRVQVMRVQYGTPLSLYLSVGVALLGTLATAALILQRMSMVVKTKAETEKTKAETEKTKAETEKTKAETEKTKAETESIRADRSSAEALVPDGRTPMAKIDPASRRAIVIRAADEGSSEFQRVMNELRSRYERLADSHMDERPLKRYGLTTEDFVSVEDQQRMARGLVILDAYDLVFVIDKW